MMTPPLPLWRLPHTFNPAHINTDLIAHPELWDRDQERRTAPGTPHHEMTDIWVRCIDKSQNFGAPHDGIWYPSYRALPSLRPVIFDVMRAVEAVRLGGILITRIPPGGRIYPHVDRGWHAEFHNVKVYSVLQSNPECWNRGGDLTVCMAPGECWGFDNQIEHELRNEGATDRVSLIISMRVDH